LLEIERLQHGIRVLDLFDEEESAEKRRADFLTQTSLRSDTRQSILEGPSYMGDEQKLNNAIVKAKSRFQINQIKRESIIELAAYMGIEASIKNKKVVVMDRSDRDRLFTEHGRWIKLFGRNKKSEREIFRERLSMHVDKLQPVEEEEQPSENDVIIAGPAVDIKDRAFRLTRAINHMARRSMLSGFDVAAVTDRHMEPIWDRYEDGTPRVYVAAERKRDRLVEEIKRDFWVASGFPLLRRSGVMPERELRPRSRKMWEEFTGQLEHPPQQYLRKLVRKQLSKYLSAEEIEAAKVPKSHR
jgi:hypothetical protein